ncbi:MAG: endolytic transglycosylase MltG [Pseudomonadales bacterium]
MKLWSKLLSFAFVTVVLVGGGAVAYVLHWQQAPVELDEPMVVMVERGEPFIRFADRLADLGVIDHPRLWSVLARLSGDAHRVKAGEYQLRPGDSPDSLLARLVAGDVVTYQARIIEGWTAMEAVAALAADPVLERRLDGVTVRTLLEVLGLPGGHAEGLFFPDTYRFVRGDSDADILRRAYARMQNVLQQAWSNRAEGLPYETPYDALIVASLIEKETGREAERPLVSQVFVLRLNLGMRLQTDPTVIYGLGDAFGGTLRRSDLREHTPYNTYRNHGLPPTPIALPGAGSIEAALHPADGDYVYFVSRGDGSSKFSVTLEEHNEAVYRYLRSGRSSTDSSR